MRGVEAWADPPLRAGLLLEVLKHRSDSSKGVQRPIKEPTSNSRGGIWLKCHRAAAPRPPAAAGTPGHGRISLFLPPAATQDIITA